MTYDHLQPADDCVERCGRVAVLMGGTSAEREVSLVSGRSVEMGLRQAGVDVIAVDIGSNPVEQLTQLQADRVFNVLHGRGGEDGLIQGLLEALNLPYVGSGIKASAVTMDKLMTKQLLRGYGIPTPAFVEIIHRQDLDRVAAELGFPVVVKPANEGSSIGMSKVDAVEELLPAYRSALRYGPVMVEQWINGPEYTVAWLGDSVLPAIRLETPHVFYDYAAKYEDDTTRYICPCGLDPEALKQLENLVLQAVRACDLRHWGRMDFLRDQHGNFQLIDINTVPGMTDHSLVPMAAREAGLDFSSLVVKLLELTLPLGENE